MLEVAGENRDEVGDTQKQYKSTEHFCGCQHLRNWGARRHLEKGVVRPCQTLTWIVSGLVG